MSLANKRVNAVGLLREFGREEIAKGAAVNSVYWNLYTTIDDVLQDFMTEHDLKGAKYWHHPESDSYFVTAPGQSIGTGMDAELCIELTRYEFLSRKGLHFPYHDNEL